MSNNFNKILDAYRQAFKDSELPNALEHLKGSTTYLTASVVEFLENAVENLNKINDDEDLDSLNSLLDLENLKNNVNLESLLSQVNTDGYFSRIAEYLTREEKLDQYFKAHKDK